MATVDLAGRDVTNRLLQLLQKRYPSLNEADFEAIASLKEKHCYVSKTFEAELQLSREKTDLQQNFTMPNGTQLSVGDERFRAPEVLFKPNLLGLETVGLQHHLANAIISCPMDMRLPLVNNICLDLGCSQLAGFGARLALELEDIHPHIFAQPNIVQQKELGVWTGGSILASLTTFQQMWISRAEYDEEGPIIVHRRCF